MTKNAKNLAIDILNCFVIDELAGLSGFYCKISKMDGGVIIEVGQMYNYIQFSLSSLIALSAIFGTEDIDLEEHSASGCDTCDYGSDYCRTIYIRNLTLKSEEVKELIGKNLCKITK